ncbi:hypothetical protein ACQKP5_09090 [Pseudomonas vancouverensis]|uniref:hypothetical protein n=1 Tax=Pseudomonas vancouverensis TaxID=95300 RepID=UPI003CFEE9D9
MDDIEDTNTESDFAEMIEEAKEESNVMWNAIKPVSSHSHVMCFIYNGTAETFALNYSSWDSSKESHRYTLQPWDYVSFVLRGDIPYFANGRQTTKTQHNFSYRSAHHAFEFSTTLKVAKKYDPLSFSPPTIPIQQHQVLSNGKVPLRCSSKMTHSLTNKPYHYAILISLGKAP